ncbi:RmlC-like cupin domain-containing protein [Mycena crocata]|nr:RmlC-like cupin domain-containing protein [Mycena crocata]
MPDDEALLDLPITGQGTIAVRTRTSAGLQIVVDGAAKKSLVLHITADSCDLYVVETGGVPAPPSEATRIPAIALKGTAATYLNSEAETTYWLSLDNANGVLRYGKHYLSSAQTLLQAVLKSDDNEGKKTWCDQRYKWLDGLKTFSVTSDGEEIPQANIRVLRLPIVRDLLPYIAHDQLSLLDLEHGTFTVPANLPPTCQTLYHNVGGPNIVLNTPDFPEFSKAIQRSVSTAGCLGHKLLEKKAGEFGWDGTYLRITLGLSKGNSPGVPYVLEIWPSGHHSPVHDHGKSFAVIKVLHGSIQCTYFETIQEGREPVQLGPKATFQESAVTWLGDETYQVHQLRNISEDVCCTIQCYQYDDSNDEHQHYFRYVDQACEVKPFEPNSDSACQLFSRRLLSLKDIVIAVTFTDFRNAVKHEWETRLQ